MAATDEYENQLPVQNTGKHIRALDANGNPILIPIDEMAKVVGGLLPLANADNKGLMSISNYRRMGRNFTKGYRKLAESPVWYNHYGALIYAASPASTDGVMIAISWKGTTFSATRIIGSNNNVRLYTGDNPNTGNHELWLGMTGNDGIASEMIVRDGTDLDWNSTTVDSLPTYLSEIYIS